MIHGAQIAAYRNIKIEPIVLVVQALGFKQIASLVTFCVVVGLEKMIFHGDLAQHFPAKISKDIITAYAKYNIPNFYYTYLGYKY